MAKMFRAPSTFAGLLMCSALALAAPPMDSNLAHDHGHAQGDEEPAPPTTNQGRTFSQRQHQLEPDLPQSTPVIAIVIDDIGYQRSYGLNALELPGAVTYAVLPHTPHGPSLASLAHSLDKEVLIHLPMEAQSGKNLGPGGLTSQQNHQSFVQTARAAFESVPHAHGVSNHMGSRLTKLKQPMQWLMKLVHARDDWLFFDSRTTGGSVAESTARSFGLRTTSRDVFLDNSKNRPAIRARLNELLEIALRRGSAVAIGHPYPQTLAVLREQIPRLLARGVRLVSLSELIAMRASSAWRVAQSSGQAAITR